MKRITTILLAAMLTIAANAQQVNTLFFLENAPMRHTINPALQPVSDGYFMLTPLGWMSAQGGNNSLTMSDLIYTNNGQTITALHPDGDKNKMLKAMKRNTLAGGEVDFNILGWGFRRTKDPKGYIHIGIRERVDAGVNMPKAFPQFLLGGLMTDLNGVNTLSMSGLNTQVQMFTEFSGGYSYKINDQWTVGGKLKFLLGQAYVGETFKDLGIDMSKDQWALHGDGKIYAAGPVNYDALPRTLSYEQVQQMDMDKFLPELNTTGDYLKLLKPSGYGAAIDLGFTYKPAEWVQISAALNDLGFLYWNGVRYNAAIDTTYNGLGDLKYGDYVVDGKFQSDSLVNQIENRMLGLLKGIRGVQDKAGFARMITTRLNVGADFNFYHNMFGLGVLSSTKVYNGKFYEEVTLGGAIRPCNWFNFAVSYSLVNNGKYSNLGAGISIMPYDGINLTLAMDYIPTNYASLNKQEGAAYCIPYKTSNVNVAFGLSIVWGTNKPKDKDKDGVFDKLDMCPNTPLGVRVDALGCPIDSDGDGVPDYMDRCPGTPVAAYGLIDSVGCPIDTDGDGVPDYLDKCPNTPQGAWGFVDENGCELDTDEDGVPDWRDSCRNTPAEERPYIDSLGCTVFTDDDQDGVPNWKDLCPDTPEEEREHVDSTGCTIMTDDDGDGVPNWKDRCPNTPAGARGFVDEFGCEIDTDGDEVMDWEDECPTVPGPRINKGCPTLSREVTKLLQKAMQGIEFETGKAVIKSKSFSLLNEIAKTFIDNPTYQIEVQGHTDNTGSEQLNIKLSQDRANSVRNYLIKQGVEEDRMTAIGYGPSMPIADNKTKAGRQKNRRVEFKITFEEKHTEEVFDHLDEKLAAEEAMKAAAADSTALEATAAEETKATAE